MPTDIDGCIDVARMTPRGRDCHIDLDHVRVSRKPRKGEIGLPRFIKITPDLAWAFGFFFAEGVKTYPGVGVCNQEIALIKKFKRIVEDKFYLNPGSWRAYIKSASLDLDETATRWGLELDVDKVRAYFLSTTRKDAIDLRVNGKIFAEIFIRIANAALPFILERRELALAFLDAYEVGDGSIIQRRGCLYGVVITVKNAKMKDFLVAAFTKLYGIFPKVRKTKGCFEIQIRGVHTMTNIILDGHFRSSERQWSKLLACYLNKEYARSHSRYWLALEDSELTIEEIAIKSNRSHWSVRDAMNIDYRLNLVEMNRRRIKGSKAPYFKV